MPIDSTGLTLYLMASEVVDQSALWDHYTAVAQFLLLAALMASANQLQLKLIKPG